MKKPHEENWDVGHPYGGVFIWTADAHPENAPHSDLAVATFYNEERARLAAQAPAMARLLLEMLGPETHGGDPAICAQERLAWALNFEPRLRKTLRDAGVIE